MSPQNLDLLSVLLRSLLPGAFLHACEDALEVLVSAKRIIARLFHALKIPVCEIVTNVPVEAFTGDGGTGQRVITFWKRQFRGKIRSKWISRLQCVTF